MGLVGMGARIALDVDGVWETLIIIKSRSG